MVYSQAVTPDNPEILEAKRLNIPLKSYPAALGDLTRKYKTIAIAGSHGKSTTTALMALIFMEAGLDPTVIIGTKLKEFGGSPRNGAGRNFRLGKSKYLIVEADEYKDSFLNYHPQGILVTNVDREHLDHYKNFKNVKKVFLNFMGNLAAGGVLVLNKDDRPLFSLADKLRNKKILWFSLKDVKRVKQIKKVLKIPGTHNVSNALGAFNLARSFGIKEKVILKALSKYRGAWRRMEYRGNLKSQILNLKTPVYDDYAHHPTEIKATLNAFKEKYPESILICVFQPHQSRRLNILFKEFVNAFNKANVLILLDIYKVSGRDELSYNIGSCNENKFRRKTSRTFYNNRIVAKYSSEELSQAISKRKSSPKVFYLPHLGKLKQIIQKVLKANKAKKLKAVIVMMGAGSIVNLTPKLLK